MKYCLAVDIGASSGRHIVGWTENGKIMSEEVFRFPNGVTVQNGSTVWDIDSLLENVKTGIKKAKEKFPNIQSLSIDTWAVDYVLLKNQEEVLPCFAYRDTRTKNVIEKVHEIIPFSELYDKTGIQFQSFNTIYQLYSDKLSGKLNGVTDFLMIPEYLLWKLCGVKSKEYTNATTTGMVNAETGQFDEEIISKLGFDKNLFCDLSKPGTVIGEYDGIKCILCATHDTASAVEGIPMTKNAPYISSGTWSLLGVKTDRAITNEKSRLANWSNEGGVGYNRFQKNIMGNWLTNELKRELCPDMPFKELDAEVEKNNFAATIDANSNEFLAPKSMKTAFDNALSEKPTCIADYFRCAYHSLAISYKTAMRELEEITEKKYDSLYMVGGGVKNKLLNKMTEEETGLNIIALPIEATALGNLKIQLTNNL